MSRKKRVKVRALVDELARIHPQLEDPQALIVGGDVVVDGIVRTNPASRVRTGAPITLRTEPRLRGEVKLRGALAAFRVEVRGRVALDVGASAGGFTRALLDAGAACVYAVDAGHGQLLGSLRQDERVVNLEATNLADLNRNLVPEPIEVVTIDLSYIPLRDAAPQLESVAFAQRAELIALVKPQFELRRPDLPKLRSQLDAAVSRAHRGFASSGWEVRGVIESPVRGAGGAIEFFLHATRLSSRGWRRSN